MRPSIGAHWGALEILDLRSEPIKRKKGTDSAVTEHSYETVMSLECDCGKIFDVPLFKFPGKRTMRDCGCGSGEGRKGKAVAAYMDHKTINQVSEFAKLHGMTVSKAFTRLVQMGLESGSDELRSAEIAEVAGKHSG